MENKQSNVFGKKEYLACMGKSGSIWVGKESYQYLTAVSMQQRLNRIPEQDILERKWNYKLNVVGMNGMVQLTDNSFGGVNPEGKWCRWSLQDLRVLLSEKGLAWVEGDEVEFLSL